MRLKPLFAAVYLKFNPLAAALPLAPRLAPAALLRRGKRPRSSRLSAPAAHLRGTAQKADTPLKQLHKKRPSPTN